jgi:MFS family permease
MTQPLAMFEAFRYPNFGLYLSARVLATLAVQMQGVAVGWQVYAITNDPLDLGLIGLAQFLPFMVFVLPAGQVADRVNRRLVLALCYALEVLCALALLWFSLYALPGDATPQIWPVLAVMAVFGTARAFAMPASQAITPNLVPPHVFANAVALSSTLGHAATIAGPALGGFLYLAGPNVVYSIVAGALAVSVLLMLRVRLPPIRAAAGPATWHTLLEGLHFVRSRPIVLGAITLDLFAVLVGGATALLPAFAKDVLDAGPAALGMLRMAPAVGATLVAIVLVMRPITRHVGRWLFACVALFGAATAVFGLSTHFALSMVALAVLGGADEVSVFIRHMLIQLETPDAIRGRVSAVNAVFIGASNELGEFESGLTAKWFGLVPAVVLGGVATIAVTGLAMRMFPELRKIDRFPQPAQQ